MRVQELRQRVVSLLASEEALVLVAEGCILLTDIWMKGGMLRVLLGLATRRGLLPRPKVELREAGRMAHF